MESEDHTAEKNRDDLLTLVEEANDLLAQGLENAQMTAERGGMRPTTVMAFNKMQEASDTLCTIDPTRENPDE